MIQDILGRVQRLLLSPAAEWDAIDGETANMGDLYKNYVLPLIVFATTAVVIGSLWDGFHFVIITEWIKRVILAAAGVYIFSLIVDALAPTFGGQKNAGQAFKVAAHAPTAAWVASIFSIIPGLSILSFIGGLYSLYLLYVGLPKLMNCPADKTLLYTIAICVCVIVVAVVLSLLLVPLIIGASIL